jgi:hypothetical protein
MPSGAAPLIRLKVWVIKAWGTAPGMLRIDLQAEGLRYNVLDKLNHKYTFCHVRYFIFSDFEIYYNADLQSAILSTTYLGRCPRLL